MFKNALKNTVDSKKHVLGSNATEQVKFQDNFAKNVKNKQDK